MLKLSEETSPSVQSQLFTSPALTGTCGSKLGIWSLWSVHGTAGPHLPLRHHRNTEQCYKCYLINWGLENSRREGSRFSHHQEGNRLLKSQLCLCTTMKLYVYINWQVKLSSWAQFSTSVPFDGDRCLLPLQPNASVCQQGQARWLK